MTPHIKSLARFSRRLLMFAFVLVLALLFCEASSPASAEDIYYIKSVRTETYPTGSGVCDLPSTGQLFSSMNVTTITSGVTVTGWSMVDMYGNTCWDRVENKNYTLTVNVATQAVNAVFTSATTGFINGVEANISVSADGCSATLTRTITPNQVLPTIYKHPGDETQDAGGTFSFVAVASETCTSAQWYIRATNGAEYPVEEISNVVPDVTCNVYDHGSSGNTLTLNNVPYQMDSWQVYCRFFSPCGDVDTDTAYINVRGAVYVIETPEPTPVIVSTPALTIVETPEPTAELVTIIETPEPTTDVWVVEEDWSEDWSYDSESHWHESRIPEVTDVNEKAAHTLIWTETKAATKKEDGEKTGVCSVCGYTETQPVVYVRPERTSLALPSSIKLVIAAVIAVLLIALLVVFIQYRSAKKRRRRRSGSRDRYDRR